MDLKENTCKLCFEIPKNGCQIIDETTMEILDILKLKIESEIINDHVMCKACLQAVRISFYFKSTCIYMEKLILAFADGKNVTRIDIKDIYTNNTDAATIIDDKIGRCRLCLNQSKIGSLISMDAFISNAEYGDILPRFLPEVDLNLVKDPLVCTICGEKLQYYFKFALNCLSTEKKIDVDLVKNEPNGHTEVYLKLPKTEAENAFDIKYEELNLNADICKIPSEQLAEQMDRFFYNENPKIKFEITEEGKYECAFCSYKSKQKMTMIYHVRVHKNKLEAKKYRCVTCPYRTNRKHDVRQHILKMHKDVSQIEMLQCTKCPFKSKYKNSIKEHMLCHKDASEIRMYKCPLCTYKTKHNRVVAAHMVIHKDPSEVEMHKCTLCSYETWRKSDLKRHTLIHSKVSSKVKSFTFTEIHECTFCSYKTRRKSDLKRHTLIHSKVASKVKSFAFNV